MNPLKSQFTSEYEEQRKQDREAMLRAMNNPQPVELKEMKKKKHSFEVVSK